MIIHSIPLTSFLIRGPLDVNIADNELRMETKVAINTLFSKTETPIKTYLYLPDRYKLPFTIDMTVKIDSPALYLLIGKGHVGFATGILDNRRITDVLGNDYKPNSHMFDNDIPIGEYVDLSITYGKTAMWVSINGALRCFSKKDPYIKAIKGNAWPEAFKDGLNVALAADKRTQVTLKSFTVTVYDEEPATPAQKSATQPAPTLSPADKPTVAECVQRLAPQLQAEVLRTDEYLLKHMKKSLRLKRTIEGGFPCCRITYVSPFGFRYKVHVSDTYVWHDICWIAYNTNREREKFGGLRKADYTVDVLEQLAKEVPAFGDAMFDRMKECTGCYYNFGGCMGRQKYIYQGKTKVSCGGKLEFNMTPSDFADARKVIAAIADVLPKE